MFFWLFLSIDKASSNFVKIKKIYFTNLFKTCYKNVVLQMYYLTSSSLNSYTINLQLGASSDREDIVVAVCSAEAASNKLSELSCYTAVVRYLHQGDRIYVTQRERDRRIIFRENKSFLGLTLLNSAHGFI